MRSWTKAYLPRGIRQGWPTLRDPDPLRPRRRDALCPRLGGQPHAESLAGGVDICVTVTLVDGYVLARSAFHHSMNYRSIVMLGRAHW